MRPGMTVANSGPTCVPAHWQGSANSLNSVHNCAISREKLHDRQHRWMGPHPVRQVRHRDRGKPDRSRRQRGDGRRRPAGLRCGRDHPRPFQRRLLAAGFYRLAGAAGRSRASLQAGDARRERLRHRLGRRASGGQVDQGRHGEDRAGGRRRADDPHARPRDRQEFAPCVLSARRRRDAGRLRRRVRQHRQGLLPALRRPVRCTRR